MSALSQPLVLVEDVHLTLGSAAGPVNVLRGVSLAMDAGESVGLVGPSGSGKTTLMMVLGGLERPNAGRVVIAGADLGALDEDALARFRRDTIGIVFQSFHLVPTMTALENVAIPLELAGRGDAFDAARAGLEAVGLGARVLHYPSQLSGGEQQRVAIARAFVAAAQAAARRRADRQSRRRDRAASSWICCSACSAEHGTALLLITHDHELARALRPHRRPRRRPHRRRRRPSPRRSPNDACRSACACRRELRGGVAGLPHLPCCASRWAWR